MNSAELRSRHEETYRRFFEANDLVVSGCYSVSWWNDLVDYRSTFPAVQIKIPLKCYVGFRRATCGTAMFTTITQYQGSEDRFETVRYTGTPETKEHIRKLLLKRGTVFGMEIEILTEIPRGHSFGFTETSSALIALWCGILSGSVNPDEIRDFPFFRKSSAWKELVDFAWSISLGPRSGNSVANGIRSTLSEFGWPVVYYSEKFDPERVWPVSELSRGEFPIEALLESPFFGDHKDLPFDFSVIFSGVEGNSGQIEEFMKIDRNLIESTEVFKRSLEKFLQDESAPFSRTEDPQVPYGVFKELKSFLGIRTIELFRQVLSDGWSDDVAVESLIENVNHYRYLLSLVSKQGDFSANFLHAFHGFRTSSEEKIGICPLYSGKFGGSYLIVTKSGISRDTIDKSLAEIQRKTPRCHMEYSFPKDGTTSDAPKIEQFATSGIRSAYVGEWQVLYRNNQGETKICAYGEIGSPESDEITVDAIAKKIYFRGEKLTSKEVPSQNAAADLLRLLVEEVGEEISNRRLPASSYSKNKNELVGKVLVPLTKFVKERTTGHLPLRCFGTLNDFRVVLDRWGVKIGVIQKI